MGVEFRLGLTASAPTAALGERAMSDFLDSIPTVVYLLGGAIVVLLVVWAVFKSVWKVAEPDEALILSGLSGRNTATAEGLDFKIVTGKGTVVLPGLQTVRSLKLSLYETALDVTCVTTQGIPVIVRGVVIFKIGDTQPFIANAARRFLGQQNQMTGQVYNVFEGHLRSIIGSLTVEEMIRERDKLGSTDVSVGGRSWRWDGRGGCPRGRTFEAIRSIPRFVLALSSPGWGSRWSPRSAARRTDLDAHPGDDDDRPARDGLALQVVRRPARSSGAPALACSSG